MALALKYHNPSKTSSQQRRSVQIKHTELALSNAAQAPIEWEPVDVTPILKDGKTAIPDKAIDSVKKNFVALKGPLAVWPVLAYTSFPVADYLVDPHRQRPCLAELNPPPHLQPLRQRSPLQIHCRLQNPLRQC